MPGSQLFYTSCQPTQPFQALVASFRAHCLNPRPGLQLKSPTIRSKPPPTRITQRPIGETSSAHPPYPDEYPDQRPTGEARDLYLASSGVTQRSDLTLQIEPLDAS